jgi:DNA modification methylase
MSSLNILHPSVPSSLTPTGKQLGLFDEVLRVYGDKESVSNDDLYRALCDTGAINDADLKLRQPVGRTGQMHSLVRRKVRWYQQTLKRLGLIERVEGARGSWRAVGRSDGDAQKDGLTPALPGVMLVAFSTKLGVAIWADSRHVFSRMDEPIHLCLTSPPYCLAQPRAYGNPTQAQYVDFICESLEPIVRNLVAGGSICLNVSNDIFDRGSPARSLVRERMVIALHERLGLHKVDEIIWSNPSKAPGPIAWASKKRVHLNVGWEPVYWFTNDPSKLRSDNRRVLLPHTDRHLKLVEQGGEQRRAAYGDGANKLRPGSFGKPTPGRIPRNVITVGHRCGHQTPARNAAKEAGFPVHGATMPYSLADFLVRLTTEEGDLVVDQFAGYMTTAEAAERNGRRWVVAEKNFEYLWPGSARFANCEGFELYMSL